MCPRNLCRAVVAKAGIGVPSGMLRKRRFDGIAFDVAAALQKIAVFIHGRAPKASLKDVSDPSIRGAVIVGVTPLDHLRKCGHLFKRGAVDERVHVIGHEAIMININTMDALIFFKQGLEALVITGPMKEVFLMNTPADPVINSTGTFPALFPWHV